MTNTKQFWKQADLPDLFDSAVWFVKTNKSYNRTSNTIFYTELTVPHRKTHSWQSNKLNLRQLILSICAVFSVLHEQILTALSRGGRQTQDICFSASRRHGRDFDTGCQGNLTRQDSCFIRALKKCAAVALARVFRTSFCLLLDCYALRRWHWNGMSCKTDERGERRKERDRQREREKEESDPWPLRPCDVSGAGRGRNWEWHSWLELPNCHFLSSLFTHSRSLSRTFEEQRTDMCLIVQPSLLTVIIVVHDHSINITVQHPSTKQGRKNGGNGSSTMGQHMSLCVCFFLVIDWNIKLSLSSSLPLFNSLCLLWCIIGFGSPQWLSAIKLL